MFALNISVTIYKPVQEVFDFVCNPENDFLWQYGTLASTKLSEDFGHAGTFFRSVGHLMGQRTQSTFEVTEYEQNKKYCFQSLSGVLNSHTTYTFGLANGCTQFNVLTQIQIVNEIPININILEKKLRKQLKENLALLKEILEKHQKPLKYQMQHSHINIERH